MDRTAWIVVALCVIGLVLWEIYLSKQMTPRPARVTAAPGQASPTATPQIVVVSPSPTPEAALKPAEAVPSFAEKIETLRNSDVELRLTNRGGGISEAVMLNHIGEGDKRVILKSPKQTPIGAIVEKPAAPALSEFALSRDADGSVRCERATPDG